MKVLIKEYKFQYITWSIPNPYITLDYTINIIDHENILNDTLYMR